MIDAQLQQDLNRVLGSLKKLEPFIRKSGKADLMEAAKILESAVKGRTPIGEKAHKRYAARKGRRAGKGSGNVIATYRPGNLQRAMRRLNFRRSTAAFVGPKLGGKTPDGYYAHMVERGTVHQTAQNFVKKAVESSGPQTLRFAIKLISRRIESYGKTNGFK
jgi:HK97 gp10 family phage protein